MAVVDPMLWDEFVEFCEERFYDLADAVAKALGEQRDYETQSSYSSSKFDVYLRGRLAESLAALREEEKREKEAQAEPEPEADKDGMVTVTIEAPDDFPWQ
jgi:hypothetical protein